MANNEAIKSYLKEALDLKQAVSTDPVLLENIAKAIDCINESYKNKGKLLIAGNGGSAADSQHFAAELVSKYKLERRGYPAIALSVNTSVLTAYSNDYDYTGVFARQVEALGAAGDVFVGLSTSGNSKNIIAAAEKAKSMGIKTILLLGGSGGKLKGTGDIEIIVPSSNTPRIQENHIFIIHIISEEVEKNFEKL